MKLAKILYLSEQAGDEHARTLALLEGESASAGLAVEWLPVHSRAEALHAMCQPGVEALVGPAVVWGDETLRVFGEMDFERPPLILVALRGQSRMASSWVAHGALDVVPVGDPWRIVPALRHAMARYDRARMAIEKQRRVALFDIVEQLSLARTVEDVTGIVTRAARTLTQAEGSAFVMREQGEVCYVDEDVPEPLWRGRRHGLNGCLAGWTIQNAHVAVVEDIYTDLRVPIEFYASTFIRSMVMVPVRTASPLGAVGAYWAAPRRASDDEVELLQALADTAVVALENVQATSELERRLQDRTREARVLRDELSAVRRAAVAAPEALR